MTSLDRQSNGDLRVAHLIETDGPGGAERVVALLARTLQASGARNVVFLPEHGEGWLARELHGSGVEIDHFHLDKPFSPLCSRLLAAALRRHQVDVAHSHEFSMAVYGAWASRRARIPHVITMHGSRYYNGRLRRRVALRAAILASDCTVAVSDNLSHALRRELWMARTRVATVANGVAHPVPDRVTLRQELGLGPGDRLLVAVGNLYPVKGHRYLLEAVGLLSERRPSLHVAIAGRGGLHEALAAQASALGIGARVHFLGLRSDVSAVLAAADVFVLPSVSEGLPLALLEAMFEARPIIASDVGEVSLALAHGDAGMLVPPGDSPALAAALDVIVGDPERAAAMGQRAQQRALAEFDVSRMVTRYLTIYRSVTERRHDHWT
jgi:glycosyltransferase involved in cell wall biosynthesis